MIVTGLTVFNSYVRKTYYADPSHGCLHPQFLVFRYYSGLVHTLRLTAMDFASPIFSMLGRLHGANLLFPALRNVAWSDRMGDITAVSKRSFGLVSRATLLTSLVISITNPQQTTDSQRLRTLEHLHALLG